MQFFAPIWPKSQIRHFLRAISRVFFVVSRKLWWDREPFAPAGPPSTKFLEFALQTFANSASKKAGSRFGQKMAKKCQNRKSAIFRGRDLLCFSTALPELWWDGNPIAAADTPSTKALGFIPIFFPISASKKGILRFGQKSIPQKRVFYGGAAKKETFTGEIRQTAIWLSTSS